MKNFMVSCFSCFKFILKFFVFFKKFISTIFFYFFISLSVVTFYFLFIKDRFFDKYRGALLVDISGAIVDKVSIVNPIDKLKNKIFSFSYNKVSETSLFSIVQSIRCAINDKNISGIVLKLDNLESADYPSLEYIGKALTEFKKSGKKIYAIGNNYNQIQYYLASFANKVYMAKYGSININGFSINRLYYKDFLDKIKINVHVFRVGSYKSAVEPFIRNNMSSKLKKSDFLLINFMWNRYLDTIAKNRKINKNSIFPEITKFINKINYLKGDLAEYYKRQCLVDVISSNIDMEREMIKKFGVNNSNKMFNYISIYDYFKISNASRLKGKKFVSNIAVIAIQGPILNEYDAIDNLCKLSSIIWQIRNAKNNPLIKSVIIRINSPGGTINAAEIIRDELMDLKKSKKPIIVSMGGLSTSAAYLISTAADYIISSSTTLTGSIGIFSIINTYENTLNYIGIHSDGVSTTPISNVSSLRGINRHFSNIVKSRIKNGYNKFVKYISESRNKSFADVKKISNGRVLNGMNAKILGLVDMIGDFDDAIYKASSLAGVKFPILDWMEPEVNVFDKLMFKFISGMNVIFSDALNYFFILNEDKYIKKQIDFYRKIMISNEIYALCVGYDYLF